MKSGFKLNTSIATAALVLAAVFTCTTQDAAAADWRTSSITRADCFRRGTDGDMGRQMGGRNATRIVNAIWQRLGQTCNQVDRLAMILADTPLARPMRGGAFAACFYLGYTDAIWEQLDMTYERCGLRCFSTGIEIGSMSAQGYCAASVAVGGLYDPGFIAQPPLPFCGQNLVLGCKTEYVSVATFEYPGCYAYTVGSFTETFDNSVRQDCFVPSDVPIRDRDSNMADPLAEILSLN